MALVGTNEGSQTGQYPITLWRRDFRAVRELLVRPPIIVYDDLTLREAADHIVGRLVVVRRDNPGKVIGIITRSDLLMAQRRRLDEMKLHKSILFRTAKIKSQPETTTAGP